MNGATVSMCTSYLCTNTHTIVFFLLDFFKKKSKSLLFIYLFFFLSALVSTGRLIPDVCTQCNYSMWYSGLLSATNAGISPNGILLSAETPMKVAACLICTSVLIHQDWVIWSQTDGSLFTQWPLQLGSAGPALKITPSSFMWTNN